MPSYERATVATGRTTMAASPGREEMHVSNVGDLGRRIATRRGELGLSPEELAGRAAMDPGYIRSLESSPAPLPSRSALWRLAAALDTTLEALTGGGMEVSPGNRSTPSVRPILQPLDREECLAALGSGGVGRIVFIEARGPVALPVNFGLLDGDVVFRTEPMPTLTSYATQTKVSFEVDHLDEALAEGWSVLISGEASEIVDPAEREKVEALGITPWAAGERDVYIRIISHEITGRRIRH